MPITFFRCSGGSRLNSDLSKDVHSSYCLLPISGVPVVLKTGKVPSTAELRLVQTNTVPNVEKVCIHYS